MAWIAFELLQIGLLGAAFFIISRLVLAAREELCGLDLAAALDQALTDFVDGLNAGSN